MFSSETDSIFFKLVCNYASFLDLKSLYYYSFFSRSLIYSWRLLIVFYIYAMEDLLLAKTS